MIYQYSVRSTLYSQDIAKASVLPKVDFPDSFVPAILILSNNYSKFTQCITLSGIFKGLINILLNSKKLFITPNTKGLLFYMVLHKHDESHTCYQHPELYTYAVNTTNNLSSPQSRAKKAKVIIYGGNGFVGTHVAKRLVEANAYAVCLSRTGHKPIHLQDEEWSSQACWSKGDASAPDSKLLASADCLICLVGSAPLPTFSQASYNEKVFTNGTANANVIKAAAEAGIKKVILLGAKIPWPLRRDSFAYTKGKNLALNAASEFAQLSEQHTAVVLQPGMIYGKRFLANGKSIPLNTLLGPIPHIMPGQFVSVETVANRIIEMALTEGAHTGKLTIIKNADI